MLARGFTGYVSSEVHMCHCLVISRLLKQEVTRLIRDAAAWTVRARDTSQLNKPYSHLRLSHLAERPRRLQVTDTVKPPRT